MIGPPKWAELPAVHCNEMGPLAWLCSHLWSCEVPAVVPLIRCYDWAMLQGGPFNNSCLGEVSGSPPQPNVPTGWTPCLGGATGRISLSDGPQPVLLQSRAEALCLNLVGLQVAFTISEATACALLPSVGLGHILVGRGLQL